MGRVQLSFDESPSCNLLLRTKNHLWSVGPRKRGNSPMRKDERAHSYSSSALKQSDSDVWAGCLSRHPSQSWLLNGPRQTRLQLKAHFTQSMIHSLHSCSHPPGDCHHSSRLSTQCQRQTMPVQLLVPCLSIAHVAVLMSTLVHR